MTCRHTKFGGVTERKWNEAGQTVSSLVSEIERLEGIPAKVLLRRGRNVPRIAEARFAVMAVAHSRGHSLPSIARAIGRDDHTTVLHGVRRAEELRRSDPGFAALLSCLDCAVA